MLLCVSCAEPGNYTMNDLNVLLYKVEQSETKIMSNCSRERPDARCPVVEQAQGLHGKKTTRSSPACRVRKAHARTLLLHVSHLTQQIKLFEPVTAKAKTTLSSEHRSRDHFLSRSHREHIQYHMPIKCFRTWESNCPCCQLCGTELHQCRG